MFSIAAFICAASALPEKFVFARFVTFAEKAVTLSEISAGFALHLFTRLSPRV